MKYFNEIFQLIVLVTLAVYIYVVGEPNNVQLIIGAFIGLLTGQKVEKLRKE